MRTETVHRLTTRELALIEEAVRGYGFPGIDKTITDHLIEKIAKADGGKLTRRVATETGKDR